MRACSTLASTAASARTRLLRCGWSVCTTLIACPLSTEMPVRANQAVSYWPGYDSKHAAGARRMHCGGYADGLCTLQGASAGPRAACTWQAELGTYV